MSQILIVEDDKVARELLDEILRREGHTVDAVAVGRRGDRACRQGATTTS